MVEEDDGQATNVEYAIDEDGVAVATSMVAPITRGERGLVGASLGLSFINFTFFFEPMEFARAFLF